MCADFLQQAETFSGASNGTLAEACGLREGGAFFRKNLFHGVKEAEKCGH